jgi:hypothetical protein
MGRKAKQPVSKPVQKCSENYPLQPLILFSYPLYIFFLNSLERKVYDRVRRKEDSRKKAQLDRNEFQESLGKGKSSKAPFENPTCISANVKLSTRIVIVLSSFARNPATPWLQFCLSSLFSSCFLEIATLALQSDLR